MSCKLNETMIKNWVFGIYYSRNKMRKMDYHIVEYSQTGKIRNLYTYKKSSVIDILQFVYI